MKFSTKSGFEFSFLSSFADDFELFDLLEQADNGNVLAVPRALKHLFDADTIKRLYEHCRVEDGHVSIQRMQEEFLEIIQSMGEASKEGKNS